ncbi:2-C-methyl-D-erythritol 4-phosphate cytidylyltransferase [Ferviditalea candida]|uniref:2-C-methyl-D-erythritol 4-phosphate cytidylyltransferase n=1 Tax=Ferviditalea candida TaxID=3108399 RepID=A0ABU5ZMA0_9BACL|nr:2-C-methyl-D-erythritol 4-phosphate cytidylyltransferase [Paenibacillaceae bacterium T2]
MGKLGVIIVAAGKGKRMGSSESKQFLPLGDKPILVHTLEVFQQMDEVDAMALVVSEEQRIRCSGYLERYGLHKVKAIAAGGKERQESVYRGIRALEAMGMEWVLVHDGVRPLVRPEKIRACWQQARDKGAAVLAVPVFDTIKVVDASGQIVSTPDRKSLWAMQTPQAFRLSDLKRAHERAMEEGYEGTDDAALAERINMPVFVVEGDYDNIKITTPEDLKWAQYVLNERLGGEGS